MSSNNYYPKLGYCANCSNPFAITGPRSKYCKECAKSRQKESVRKATYRHKVTNNIIKKPGVGSGNAQGYGPRHHSYKTGIGVFKKFKQKTCNRCGSTKNLLVHHKDHNRENNQISNLETLCKTCHQNHHCIRDNLGRYTNHD